ncbi:type II secretion system secretin GspD [Azospirillum sp. ST 5-10]|uniref:type II secretion system secretin GspD n=1 Tax=unclassified Azospirillum TaxID=2630922 RepID=UPI003F4A2BD9
MSCLRLLRPLAVWAVWLALAGCDTTPAPPPAAPTAPPPTGAAPTVLAPVPTAGWPAGIQAAPAAARVADLRLPGTGRLVRDPGPAPTPPAGAAEERYTVNFVNSDLREVVQAVLGDILKLSYTLHPDVKGAVTLQTADPVPRGALLSLLEDALALNGAALTATGQVYQVVPAGKDFRRAGRVRLVHSPDAAEAAEIAVVPLQYVPAAEMARILEPFADAADLLRVDAERNLLILGGPRSSQRTLLDLVAMFDVDWLAGKSFGLFRLDTARASQVVTELHEVFAIQGADATAAAVRLVPVERLNAVLAVTPQRAYLAKVAEWVQRLDVADPDEVQSYVYRLQHQRADELAAVLSEIYGGRRRPAARSGAGGAIPAVEAAALPAEGAAAGAGTAPGAAPGIGSALDERTDADTASAPDRRDRATFVPDMSRNALVIRATPSVYRKILTMLSELDTASLQVVIEATIVEVVLNDNLAYGVEWFFRTGDVKLQFATGTDGAFAPLTSGLSIFTGGDTNNVNVIVRALKDVSNVQVISSPTLAVLNNRTARIQVGDQVPVVTRIAQSVESADAPLVSSVQLYDTGVILEVTPRVNDSGMITLEIQQEVSDVIKTTSSEIDSPTIQQRRVSSVIAVADGQTIGLGGLIRDRKGNGTTGIPILSEVPVVGNIFKSVEDVNERTELLVLLTPRVVRTPADARLITEELRGRLRLLRDLETRIR